MLNSDKLIVLVGAFVCGMYFSDMAYSVREFLTPYEPSFSSAPYRSGFDSYDSYITSPTPISPTARSFGDPFLFFELAELRSPSEQESMDARECVRSEEQAQCERERAAATQLHQESLTAATAARSAWIREGLSTDVRAAVQFSSQRLRAFYRKRAEWRTRHFSPGSASVHRL